MLQVNKLLDMELEDEDVDFKGLLKFRSISGKKVIF